METDSQSHSGSLMVILSTFISLGATNEQIKENVEKISENGFLNYFGMQRFGCFNIMTQDVGKEAIKQNWKKVIGKSKLIILEMLLGQYPKSGVDKDRKLKIAKLALEDDDIEGALKLVQPRDRIEKVSFRSQHLGDSSIVGKSEKWVQQRVLQDLS